MLEPKCHLFVLEGLRREGLRGVYERIPRTRNNDFANNNDIYKTTQVQVLYNSEMTFSKRLYTKLDLDLLKVKLFEPIDEIVKKPLLYIRDMTPKPSYEALMKIHHLFSEHLLRDVVRCDLLPTADMMVSMSKEFGVPLNERELADMQPDSSTMHEMQQLNRGLLMLDEAGRVTLTQDETGSNENNDEEKDEYVYNYNNSDQTAANNNSGVVMVVNNNQQDETTVPHTSRYWTPIDHFNDAYLYRRKENEQMMESRDFVAENVESVAALAERSRHKRPVRRYLVGESTFNYSGQSLNSTDLALDSFREKINKVSEQML
jgi:hypothetical protein